MSCHPRVFALAALCTVLTPACWAARDRPTSTEPPPGCKQTECVARASQCNAQAPASASACSDCSSTCEGVESDLVGDCLGVCTQICSEPSPPSPCEDEATQCQDTPVNAVCIDGIDPSNVPNPWVGIDWPWVAPAAAHSGQCSASQIETLYDDCLGSSAVQSACSSDLDAMTACAGCMITQASAGAWGPIVVGPSASASGSDTWTTNAAGCVDLVSGDSTCGVLLFERQACLSSCAEANDPPTCLAFAAANDCKSEVDAAAPCVDEARTAPFAACALDQTDEASTTAIAAFFCGN